MTVNNEAGDCLEVTDVTAIKVGRKSMAFEPHADAVVSVNWGQALKLPDSTRDVKVTIVMFIIKFTSAGA